MNKNNVLNLKSISTYLIIFALGISSFNISAQNKRMVRRADNLFLFSSFNKALPVYLELLKQDPNNFMYNYRAGMCYLNSNIETHKCVSYFEKAKSSIKTANDSTPDFFYYLGHSYQITNKFDEAIKYLSLSKSMLDKHKDSINIYFIEVEIGQCENGKKAMSAPSNARLFSLGKNVNSIYPEYSPVIVPNNSMLIFTSTRSGSYGGKKTEQGEFYEDIYTSKNVWTDTTNVGDIKTSFYAPDYSGVSFAPSINAGDLINTNTHDASISVSPDGKRLFMYRKNAVWQSEFIDGELTLPGKVNYIVNGDKRYESSITLTKVGDQNILYFVSDQKDGIGGKDIYKSIKQLDGTWGPAENLGPIVNTEFDEEAPFFDANEGVLYFSSQGHNSIGGFDVFKTKFDNDVWATPKNLGYPVNSGTDDVFYSIDSKQNRGFLSTMREDGEGNYDIYMIRYLKPLKVMFAGTYSNGLQPLDRKVSIINTKTNQSVQTSLKGINEVTYNCGEKYKLQVPHYDTDTLSDSFEFETPESYGDYSYYQEINYDVVKNHNNQVVGYKTTVYNCFFDIERELAKNKNRNTDIKKEDEYSAFAKTLTSENKFFQIFSKINYLDTVALAILAEEKAARALAGSAPIVETKTTGHKHLKTKEVVKAVKESAATPTVTSYNGPAAFKTILFQFSKTTLTKEAKAELLNILAYLKENKDVKMEIIGYTDSKGKAKFNQELSKKRAVMIKNFLVKKGISAKRLKAKGLGEKNPVAPNKNEDNTDNLENRKLNRRVEFVIVERK